MEGIIKTFFFRNQYEREDEIPEYLKPKTLSRRSSFKRRWDRRSSRVQARSNIEKKDNINN